MGINEIKWSDSFSITHRSVGSDAYIKYRELLVYTNNKTCSDQLWGTASQTGITNGGEKLEIGHFAGEQ
jgi:hypothetical protein